MFQFKKDEDTTHGWYMTSRNGTPGDVWFFTTSRFDVLRTLLEMGFETEAAFVEETGTEVDDLIGIAWCYAGQSIHRDNTHPAQ